MEVKYNLEELKEFIQNGKKINYGKIGSTVLYNGKLIKFDNAIYNYLKKSSNSSYQIESFLYNACLENHFIDLKQLDYLISKQDKVKLTKFPEGICTLNDLPIGILLPYYDGYRYSLQFLDDISNEELYSILKSVLLRIKELEENGIYKLDLTAKSVLYNGISPKIVDLHGSKLKYGEDDNYKATVYNEYIMFFHSLLKSVADPKIHERFADVFNLDINNYEDCYKVVKRLEK